MNIQTADPGLRRSCCNTVSQTCFGQASDPAPRKSAAPAPSPHTCSESTQLATHTHPIDNVRARPFPQSHQLQLVANRKIGGETNESKQAYEASNSPTFQVRQNCPFCRTPDPNKWCQCVSRTLFRSCSLLGFALLIWKQPGSTLT